ncbi:putative alpha/beta-Hydrolase [Vibrio nigripulchritudo SFn27]|uniref:Putative alpha/beta-Hydrolase n=1 Tax=Vibrio nigripulchritudo TaxID=28173 RepID=U4K6M9_9VIBR|nr:alpha/beta hydrolase [Vibrio nigripulchritudo]CCN81578.1 putative alpha/beta-Hydrolase [Vibrio nigripulchritudo BLFn1]CCN91675.1 putative alpha/beta-Hydrolase [Vibrio nigripulchritudo SFn27]CCN96559.1 putative alpha/beta-Hydrolase [Vibrio nigripulchritudo ENn2]CCO38433.1 putative alpha/beta-Hydrolase [Vibrio nigripulchritudo SFn135]CCO53890.1 putative alpha/beta-Hydrolase [Vibrio nigripulchritudo Wn13]
MKVQKVKFKSLGLTLAGNLYLPEKFAPNQQYKTIVVTPPAHQIKEQTAAVYGPIFAKLGFVYLAFDYNSKGESESYKEGFRNDENSFRKHEDLRNAISYLCSVPYVDQNKLYGVGICGGGNIMSSVLITDLRVKAFASISAMLATDNVFYSDKAAYQGMITEANQARQRMFESEQSETFDLFGYEDPDYLEKNPNLPGAQLEGYEFYGTKRAGSETYPRFSNYVLSNIYESAPINIGEQYADRMVQPFLGVVGEKADTAIATELFYEKVTSEKALFKVPGASHVDLYDVEEYVNIAAEKIAQFFDGQAQ